ncbi:FAS1 domain-containing protein [Aaosphaeria arxii CBS 175.79]|uniref:FAS1 domain-containing protein n=1 Tax=Aaosphaeria arxii CBS 175.79 TaxID=1450172 RepID=A0A6A5XW48_9PLEO|nr:FAS1 domain-containing protein [Aaosphaeria arxii CBS 175.79]KAF2017166.1 FAS1 domain-containing protein [Aaosphaeria arxii CBS 175.79]
MRFQQLLPLLPLASAFVITEDAVFDKLSKIENSGRKVLKNSQNVLDDALGKTVESVKHVGDDFYHKVHKAGCDVESWLEGALDVTSGDTEEDPHHPPHRKPPHHKPPHHKDPHHDHPKPNQTVYELISKSKYTTKLAKLIDEYDDLVKTLNSTKANYTVFAPTDAAFEKIPHHGHKPSKEFLKDLLLYHVSDDFYPAGRVLHSYTIPTLYKPEKLGHAQRLTVRVTLKGPAINFYAKVVAVNIFGTNGVIHGIDSILVPPPKVAAIIDLLPGEFSTLELGLEKTGLFQKINDSDKYPHTGGTFFAPSNFAFQKLGPKINAFLFSKYGEKYLKALLKYHIVVSETLYSDAFFDDTDKEETVEEADRPPYYHFDLPTALDGKPLAVDVSRYGPFIGIRINGFSRVTVHDGVASDGVIQVVSNVLIPPKNAAGEEAFWKGEEMTVEEFKGRLEPYIFDDENLEL